jgi:Domain of unknown function (DUF5753)
MNRSTLRRTSPSDNIVWSAGEPWWQRYAVGAAEYLAWEADAHRILEWAVLRIPDLLYTPEYTRALFQADRVFCGDHFVGGRWDDAGARRIADEIESRQHRQDRLRGQRDRPVDYTVVIEEAVLRKVVGDRSIMRTQLDELLDFAGATAVTLRVLPERASAQVDTDGGMTILEFPDPRMASPMVFARYPGGVVAEVEPRVVTQAQRRFDAVLAAALPEPDSTQFIEQLTTELYPE